MRMTILLISLIFLSACGVDGEPETPTMGVHVGVGKGGDVNVSTTVRGSVGPVDVSVGF